MLYDADSAPILVHILPYETDSATTLLRILLYEADSATTLLRILLCEADSASFMLLILLCVPILLPFCFISCYMKPTLHLFLLHFATFCCMKPIPLLLCPLILLYGTDFATLIYEADFASILYPAYSKIGAGRVPLCGLNTASPLSGLSRVGAPGQNIRPNTDPTYSKFRAGRVPLCGLNNF